MLPLTNSPLTFLHLKYTTDFCPVKIKSYKAFAGKRK